MKRRGTLTKRYMLAAVVASAAIGLGVCGVNTVLPSQAPHPPTTTAVTP